MHLADYDETLGRMARQSPRGRPSGGFRRRSRGGGGNFDWSKGRLGGYEDESLGGGFSKLRKKLHKIHDKISPIKSKTILKVAKPVAHAAAAYFTGGATLALSAAMLAKEKAKKAQAEADRKAAEELKAMEAAAAAAVETAPVVATTMPVISTAPSANAVAASLPKVITPQGYTVAQEQYFAPSAEEGGAATRSAPATGTLPSWVIPAGIGMAVLVLLPMLQGGQRGRR